MRDVHLLSVRQVIKCITSGVPINLCSGNQLNIGTLSSPQGCGKSVVINEFARRLGYDTDSVVMYNDMTSRDLLQQRHTDSS